MPVRSQVRWAAGVIARVPRLGSVVLAIGVGLGIGLAFVGMAPNVPIALVTLAAIGLGVGFINVHVISWLQGRTAEEMRGRVMSLVMLGSFGLAPLSFALAGIVVDLGAVPVMFGIAGAIVVGASLLGLRLGCRRSDDLRAEHGRRGLTPAHRGAPADREVDGLARGDDPHRDVRCEAAAASAKASPRPRWRDAVACRHW